MARKKSEVIELTEVVKPRRTIRQRLRRGALFTVATMAAVDVSALAYVKVRAEVAEMAVGMAHAAVVGTAEDLGYDVSLASNTGPVRPFDAREYVSEQARKMKINPSLARALMRVESTDNYAALSPKGAIGIMQVMPEHVRYCGLDGPANLVTPKDNIDCGLAVLKDALVAQKGNPVLALQYYNGGPRHMGSAESVEHARKVLRTLGMDIQ